VFLTVYVESDVITVDYLILNINRLSHELSGVVAERERLRIETQLTDLCRCPQCGAAASFDDVIAPPPIDATEYESDAVRRAALSDYHVGVQFEPCGHEIDIEVIDGLAVTLRDGPVDVDYSAPPLP
jgi:hypothetical protein